MYYRRKILLSLLEVFDNELEKIRLKKLLLLYTQKQESPAYDFVPYKFGCFSFHANADLHTMIKYEQVSKKKKKWVRTEKKPKRSQTGAKTVPVRPHSRTPPKR